jgi:DNA-binding NtrC family response regulator
MMKSKNTDSPIRVLLIDDDRDEYRLTKHMLGTTSGSYQLDWVATFDEGLAAISEHKHDVYLVDYVLGPSDGVELIRSARAGGSRAPFIMLTGYGDRAVDMAALEAGVADYLVKGQIGPDLLERAIRYAIERKRAENEKEALIAELQEALQKVKTLSGFLPICASCKKIRDDQGYWKQVESYIKELSGAELTHSLCPDCAQEFFKEIIEEQASQQSRSSGL